MHSMLITQSQIQPASRHVADEKAARAERIKVRLRILNDLVYLLYVYVESASKKPARENASVGIEETPLTVCRPRCDASKTPGFRSDFTNTLCSTPTPAKVTDRVMQFIII